jgi:hypothetical protein
MTAAADYDALAESLSRAGVVLGLSELHGGVCGALCAGGMSATRSWLDEHVQEHGAASSSSGELAEKLRDLEATTWKTLAGAQMTFEPLLPDESAPLDEQVGALALWCQGFLAGLGFGGVELERKRSEPSAELEEIVSDFAEISRAGLSEEEHSDRSQADFALAELKEYVRVSVQIVFEELGRKRDLGGSQSVH